MSPRAPLVMVIDDDEDIREVVALALESSGLRVVRAVDGLDALEQLRSVRPDLLLLDLMMPRMSGVDLARRLRNDHLLDGVPILVFSGDGSALTAAAAIGAAGLLTKPVDLDLLVATVRRVAERA